MAVVSALGNLGHARVHAQEPKRFGLGLLRALEVVERWFDRHAQRQALLELDDHMLRDIGLSRADAASEASKRFWQ